MLQSRPGQPMPFQKLADRLQELLQRPLVGDVHYLDPRLSLLVQNRRKQVHTQHQTSFRPLGIGISIQCHITRSRYNMAGDIHTDRIGASAVAHCGQRTQSEARHGRSRPSHLIAGTCAHNGTHAQLTLAASSCWIQEPGQGNARVGHRCAPGRCRSLPPRRTSPAVGLTGQCCTKLLSPLDRTSSTNGLVAEPLRFPRPCTRGLQLIARPAHRAVAAHRGARRWTAFAP